MQTVAKRIFLFSKLMEFSGSSFFALLRSEIYELNLDSARITELNEEYFQLIASSV